MNYVFIVLLLTIANAEQEFFGPHPVKQHTYSYEPIFDNTFISFNYAMVVFILPLVILLISVMFFCNIKGLFSGKGMFSLLFIGSAIAFVCFVGYSWVYFTFLETLTYGIVLVPVMLLLARFVSA